MADVEERPCKRRRYNVLLDCGHAIRLVTNNRSAFDVATAGVELRCPECGRLSWPARRGATR